MRALRVACGPSMLKGVSRARLAACAVLCLSLALVGSAIPGCSLSVAGLESVDAASMADATLLDGSDGKVDSPDDVEMARDASDAVAVDASEDVRGDGPGFEASADAAADAKDACGTVEICDNGVDDNCNGLVDCADPQCQNAGWQCLPSTPAPGWALVAYDPAGRPSCPSGWGSSVPLVEGPDAGPASCICSCGGPLANPCDDGVASLSLGQNACGCGGVQNVPLLSDGGCNLIGAPIGQPCGPWGDGLVKPIAYAGSGTVACADDPQRPPIVYGAQGQTCVALGAAGAGCVSGGSCLPNPAPAVACVEAAGILPCPPGFTTQHVVYSPSNVIDQRQCGACGCGASVTSCAAAGVTLYDDPGCVQNPVMLSADGACYSLHGDPSDAGWFRYTATLNPGSCTSDAGTTSLDGGLLLRAPATICCP